ncbi:hypothetical protein [Schlesneria paludicola]|uniref:hypothetical protein n=1 Tax=Schlesneria paludicola TaxID=360056 RepID=UPI00029B2827|nr:hypothetical protein [Schlesneria paludicola]
MVGKRKESENPIPKTAKPRSSTRKSNPKLEPNLPTVSKQTAGGIVGATIGGMIAGPIGAVAGGVAGAMIGTASAEGHHPIEAAANQVAAATKKPLAMVTKRVSSAVESAIGTVTPQSRTTHKQNKTAKAIASSTQKNPKARGVKKSSASATR